MADDLLARLFEHNNWANRKVVEACLLLIPEQLEATLDLPSPWTMSYTLQHLVGAQQGYLSLLTQPPEERVRTDPPLSKLLELLDHSGGALLEMARAPETAKSELRLATTDGHVVQVWVVMLQVINHATEHRKQLCGQLRALGATAPRVDGWAFGGSVGAIEPSLE